MLCKQDSGDLFFGLEWIAGFEKQNKVILGYWISLYGPCLSLPLDWMGFHLVGMVSVWDPCVVVQIFMQYPPSI